jgi:glycosyltransferase involved in cell wall biosynthesis
MKDARLPVAVIPNWIDAQSYQRPPTYRRISGAPVRFLFCGWLERFKGVNELVEALRIVQESGLRWELTFCGGGSQRQGLEKRVAELGLGPQVHFAGWVRGADKLTAFWGADVFVLPSYSEGLPNALLEAMAAGLPVVASRVGGIPCLVQDNVNGLLVAPRTIPELAQALLDLASQPEVRERMGALNELTIKREHDVKAIWPRVARMLELDPEDLGRRQCGPGVYRDFERAV